MGADAPQWLFSSFVDAMQEIGASAPIPVLEAEARDLISRWNARGRFLHNTRHLLKTLSRIDEIASTAHDPDVLRVALWYQGAVLNRSFDIFRRGETGDEQEFASLYHARSRMETLGVSEDVISRIQELMMALFTHRADPSDMDAQVLIDADLGMLAASPQDFKRFREIADEVGAYLMVDIAHIAGLVATGLHPSPIPYAHVTTTTTHKTLRGPRGGMIMCSNEVNEKYNFNKAIFQNIIGNIL